MLWWSQQLLRETEEDADLAIVTRPFAETVVVSEAVLEIMWVQMLWWRAWWPQRLW